MAIDHVLAVIAVADVDTTYEWYERLFGRPADNRPMEGLVEWQVTDHGWVQVTTDTARAGSSVLNLAVDDLEQHIAELARRGLAAGAVEEVSKGVQLSPIHDPDGNTITFIGNFRVRY